jgi:hypothetical protein
MSALSKRIADRKAELKKEIQGLMYTLEREIEYLDTEPDYIPNSLGVIQGNASRIDNLCGQIAALDFALRDGAIPYPGSVPTPPDETVADRGESYTDIAGVTITWNGEIVEASKDGVSSGGWDTEEDARDELSKRMLSPQPEPPPNDTAKAARLTKAQRKQLNIVSNVDLNVARLVNNTPSKSAIMYGLEKIGMVEQYSPTPHTGKSWRITDAGRAALGIGTGA